jgi:FkbM family methyltransferase
MLKKYINKPISKSKDEKATSQLLAVKLKPSDIAIDCGANIGNITALLCRTGATVYAFEPNPFAFKELQKRFLDNPKVHCIQKGVLDENGRMHLYLHEFSDQDEVKWSTGSSLLDFKGNVNKDKFVDVEIIDLTEFIGSLNQKVKILKMDVEGVECKILKKLIDTGLIYSIEHMFVETHDVKNPALKDETDQIRSLLHEKKISHVNLDWK